MHPKIKIMCVSNVYTRMMHFEKSGDVEVGHAHTYDHGTLLSSGSVRYEVLESSNGAVVDSKEFHAPAFIFVAKDKFHRLTALEDDTVCACIHALRTNDENILDPDFFIEPMAGGNGEIPRAIKERTGEMWKPLLTGQEV